MVRHLHGEGSGSRHPELRFSYYVEDANNGDGVAQLNLRQKYVCMKTTAYIQPHMVEGELVSAPLPPNWTINGYRYYLDDHQGNITTCLNRPAAPKPPDLAHTGLIFQICRAIFMEAHGNFFHADEEPQPLHDYILDFASIQMLDKDLND